MYGLKTWGKSRAQMVLAKKPTKFMTNYGGKGAMERTHTNHSWMEGREMQPDTHQLSAGLYAEDL